MSDSEAAPSPTDPPNSGLKPTKGWPARNYRFWRHRIVPQVFKKRAGEKQAAIHDRPPEGKTRITWVGHATFLVQFQDHSVIFDPNWANWHGPVKRQAEPGLDLRDLPELDLVLVSHAHFDHMHKPSLKVIEAHDGVVVPRGSATLMKRLRFSAVHEMDLWEERSIGGIRIVHTPCHHWGARYGADTFRDYGGFVVYSGNQNVFHCGDSAYFDGFQEIGKRLDIDVALMPIGAYEAPSGREVHMNPEQALQAFEDLGARLMVPMHYGTFPLGNEHPDEPIERLLAAAEERGLGNRVYVPIPGVALEL